ncbi:MAG: hypothetical protein ACK46X_07205 [Candidatus Sericytochromatia bacterium]
MYDVLLHQPTAFFQDRKVVNAVYLLVPPIGLLMMFLSPFYSTRERLVRTLMTASFIAFFAVMGPDLRAYLDAQVAAMAG